MPESLKIVATPPRRSASSSPKSATAKPGPTHEPILSALGMTRLVDGATVPTWVGNGEAVLQSIFRSERIGITVFGPDHRVRDQNQFGAFLAGSVGGATCVGKTLAGVLADAVQNYPETDSPELREQNDFLLRADRSTPFSFVRRGPGNRWLEIHSEPTVDGGFLITDIDITALQKSRQTEAERTRLLQATINSFTFGIMVFGADRNLRMTNHLGLFRLGSAGPTGCEMPPLGYAQLAARAVAHWRQMAQESGENIFVDPVLTVDPSRQSTQILTLPPGRQIEFSVKPSDDGGFIVVNSDVTEIVNARNRAESVARELHNLIDAIPGVLVRKRRNHDGSMVRIFVSNSVTPLTGYNVDQAMQPGWWFENVARSDLPELERQFERVFKEGDGVAEFRFRCLDQHWIWIRAIMRKAMASDGQEEAICIWNDVTAEREHNAQIAHATKLMHMGEVATGMAHELNQPLNNISMAAENAQRALNNMPSPPTGLHDKLSLITNQAHRAAALIEHLQVFGRSGGERSGAVHWQDVIRSAALMVEASLEENIISLESRIPDNLPPVLGRMTPLEQVLINLVKNAAEAYERSLPELAPPRRVVRFEAEARSTEVLLRVQDFAGGISENLIQRMFEPFFSTKPIGSGTGLGLSMAYGIISDMGGAIIVRNEDGGAVFEIALPRAAQ